MTLGKSQKGCEMWFGTKMESRGTLQIMLQNTTDVIKQWHSNKVSFSYWWCVIDVRSRLRPSGEQPSPEDEISLKGSRTCLHSVPNGSSQEYLMHEFAWERPDNKTQPGSETPGSADSPLIVGCLVPWESLYIISDHQRHCQESVELGLPQFCPRR